MQRLEKDPTSSNSLIDREQIIADQKLLGAQINTHDRQLPTFSDADLRGQPGFPPGSLARKRPRCRGRLSESNESQLLFQLSVSQNPARHQSTDKKVQEKPPNNQGANLNIPSKSSSFTRKKNYVQMDDQNRPIFERASEVPELPFGELKPESVPVFGYPFVNFSPRMQEGATNEDNAKNTSDKLWQVFSKAIIFQANCADHAKEEKLLLAEMIDQREENMETEDNIMKALTYGLRLSNHGVDSSTVENIQKFQSQAGNKNTSIKGSSPVERTQLLAKHQTAQANGSLSSPHSDLVLQSRRKFGERKTSSPSKFQHRNSVTNDDNQLGGEFWKKQTLVQKNDLLPSRQLSRKESITKHYRSNSPKKVEAAHDFGSKLKESEEMTRKRQNQNRKSAFVNKQKRTEERLEKFKQMKKNMKKSPAKNLDTDSPLSSKAKAIRFGGDSRESPKSPQKEKLGRRTSSPKKYHPVVNLDWQRKVADRLNHVHEKVERKINERENPNFMKEKSEVYKRNRRVIQDIQFSNKKQNRGLSKDGKRSSTVSSDVLDNPWQLEERALLRLNDVKSTYRQQKLMRFNFKPSINPTSRRIANGDFQISTRSSGGGDGALSQLTQFKKRLADLSGLADQVKKMDTDFQENTSDPTGRGTLEYEPTNGPEGKAITFEGTSESAAGLIEVRRSNIEKKRGHLFAKDSNRFVTDLELTGKHLAHSHSQDASKIQRITSEDKDEIVHLLDSQMKDFKNNEDIFFENLHQKQNEKKYKDQVNKQFEENFADFIKTAAKLQVPTISSETCQVNGGPDAEGPASSNGAAGSISNSRQIPHQKFQNTQLQNLNIKEDEGPHTDRHSQPELLQQASNLEVQMPDTQTLQTPINQTDLASAEIPQQAKVANISPIHVCSTQQPPTSLETDLNPNSPQSTTNIGSPRRIAYLIENMNQRPPSNSLIMPNGSRIQTKRIPSTYLASSSGTTQQQSRIYAKRSQAFSNMASGALASSSALDRHPKMSQVQPVIESLIKTHQENTQNLYEKEIKKRQKLLLQSRLHSSLNTSAVKKTLNLLKETNQATLIGLSGQGNVHYEQKSDSMRPKAVHFRDYADDRLGSEEHVIRDITVAQSLNLDLETSITKTDLIKEAGTVKSEAYALNLLEQRPDGRHYSKIQPKSKISSQGRTPQTQNSSRRRHIKEIIDQNSTEEPSFLKDKKFMRKHLASRYQVKFPTSSGTSKKAAQPPKDKPVMHSRNSKSMGNHQEWMNKMMNSQKRSMAFEKTAGSLDFNQQNLTSQRPSAGTSKEIMFSKLGKMKSMLDSESKASDFQVQQQEKKAADQQSTLYRHMRKSSGISFYGPNYDLYPSSQANEKDLYSYRPSPMSFNIPLCQRKQNHVKMATFVGSSSDQKKGLTIAATATDTFSRTAAGTLRESSKVPADNSSLTLTQVLNTHHDSQMNKQTSSSRREASRNKSLINLKHQSGIHESGGNISGWSQRPPYQSLLQNNKAAQQPRGPQIYANAYPGGKGGKNPKTGGHQKLKKKIVTQESGAFILSGRGKSTVIGPGKLSQLV